MTLDFTMKAETVYSVTCNICQCSLYSKDKDKINQWLEGQHDHGEEDGEFNTTDGADVRRKKQRTRKADKKGKNRQEKDNPVQASDGFTVLTGVGGHSLWG